MRFIAPVRKRVMRLPCLIRVRASDSRYAEFRWLCCDKIVPERNSQLKVRDGLSRGSDHTGNLREIGASCGQFRLK